MRIPLFIAVAEDMTAQVINSIPGLRWIPAGTIRGQNYDAVGFTAGGVERQYLCHPSNASVALVDKSVAKSGLWDLLYLLPADTVETASGPDLHRFLRRAVLGAKERTIAGPVSIGQAVAQVTEVANKLTVKDANDQPTGQVSVPIMFAGDLGPAEVAKVDYRPTDDDCLSDVRPNLTALEEMKELKDGK